MKVILGQKDYTERIQCYLRKIAPMEKLEIISFPSSSNHPMEYSFDFSACDSLLIHVARSVPIIVAVSSRYQKTVVEYLMRHGFTDIYPFSASMDNELKKQFFKKILAEKGVEFSLLDENKTVLVYMAKSVKDKSLLDRTSKQSSHLVPIQVGASLTKERVADLLDNTGENISNRNRHYSETTALYWIWKNADADYLGLCHYRRLWKDLDKIVLNLQNFVTDVVLPLPTWIEPSVMDGHLKIYTPDVWKIMVDVLKKRSPEYYTAAQHIYDGNIFYACNMLIAKRHVLNQLCSWMFPIVMEVEEIVGDLPDLYYNRYCGFCTEQLITLYFLYNKQNFRVAHAEKIFIE